MRNNGTDNARLYRLHKEQLTGLRTAERQAIELFQSLSIVAAREEIASLLRAIGTESEIQLERLERFMRTMDPAEEFGSAPLPPAIGINLASVANSENAEGDAALVAAAQRALAYQISTYESACEAARTLGAHTLLDILLLNLDEERATTAALAEIADSDAPLLRAM